jgi:glycosyltransferase involved in cell wall biosynthesis
MTDSHSAKPAAPLDRPATSVAIAAETLGAGCGLGHYLACLRSALGSQQGEGRRIAVFDATAHTPAQAPSAAGGAAGLLARLLRPLRRRLAAVAARSPAEEWAATWHALPGETVCLLPHVVCNDGGALDWYYATLARRPLVWVIHDLHPLHFPEQWDAESVATFARRCQQLALRAHTIICHNEYTKADACAKLGADAGKIVVVHLPSILPACDPASLPPAAATLRRHGIEPPYALWASSSTFAHKNHDRLLRAWRRLRDRGCDLQLVCTGGKEPRWQAIAHLIDELGLTGRVVFTGTVSREELWVVLQNAKLAVCPTLFEGGGSGPAAEAIMSRIPVVCARIPQVVEQFAGRADLCAWFDPTDEAALADVVFDLLGHYDAAVERADRAAELFPRLRSWEEVARVYWQAIERAAASARQGERST